MQDGKGVAELTRTVEKLVQTRWPLQAILAAAGGFNLEFCKPPLSSVQLEKVVKDIIEVRRPEEKDYRGFIYSLDEIIEHTQANPPAALWDGLLYRGMLHLLAGRPKAGKTTFWIWALAQLTRDDTTEILGREAVGGLKVLVISEEHGFTLSEGLLEAGADKDKISVMYANDFRVLPEKEHAEMRDTIASMGLDLVVLDTVTKVHRIKDENNNAEMAAALQPWVNFAHTTGIANLAVHQHRKTGGQHGDEVRGGGFMEATDVYWGYKRSGRERERELIVLGRYMGKGNLLEEKPLTVAWDGKNFELSTDIHGAIMGTEKQKRTLEAIYGLVKQGSVVTPKNIKELLPEERTTAIVTRHLSGLVADGILEQPNGKGKPYCLTEKGKRGCYSNTELVFDEEEDL